MTEQLTEAQAIAFYESPFWKFRKLTRNDFSREAGTEGETDAGPLNEFHAKVRHAS